MILHTSERMREIWDKYSYHAGLKNPTGSYKMFLRVFLYTGPYKIQGVLYFLLDSNNCYYASQKRTQKRPAEKSCRKDLQERTVEKTCRKELQKRTAIFILMFVLSNKSSNCVNLLNTSFSQSQNARYARTPCTYFDT